MQEIRIHYNFEKELQLFQLLCLVSPQTNAIHQNLYKQTLVLIEIHICPGQHIIPQLVS